MPTYLRCTHCKQLLPEEAFALNAYEESGRQHECRECRKRFYRPDYVPREKIDPNKVEEIRCPRCGRVLPPSEFLSNKSRPNGKQWVCTDCKREYTREAYATKPKRRDDIKAYVEKRKEATLDFIYEYLLAHPCEMCGESDPVVLEFHHRNGEEKDFSIATAVTNHLSTARVAQEMAKCMVLCCNCHTRVTSKERGWWRERKK